jgi:hypothetical protein
MAAFIQKLPANISVNPPLHNQTQWLKKMEREIKISFQKFIGQIPVSCFMCRRRASLPRPIVPSKVSSIVRYSLATPTMAKLGTAPSLRTFFRLISQIGEAILAFSLTKLASLSDDSTPRSILGIETRVGGHGIFHFMNCSLASSVMKRQKLSLIISAVQ